VLLLLAVVLLLEQPAATSAVATATALTANINRLRALNLDLPCCGASPIATDPSGTGEAPDASCSGMLKRQDGIPADGYRTGIIPGQHVTACRVQRAAG